METFGGDCSLVKISLFAQSGPTSGKKTVAEASEYCCEVCWDTSDSDANRLDFGCVAGLQYARPANGITATRVSPHTKLDIGGQPKIFVGKGGTNTVQDCTSLQTASDER